MVAHKSLKTPTAVAEFLISKFNENEGMLFELTSRVESIADGIISSEFEALKRIQLKLQYFSSISISDHQVAISNISKTIPYIFKQAIRKQSEIVHSKQAKFILHSNSLINKHKKQDDKHEVVAHLNMVRLNLKRDKQSSHNPSQQIFLLLS